MRLTMVGTTRTNGRVERRMPQNASENASATHQMRTILRKARRSRGESVIVVAAPSKCFRFMFAFGERGVMCHRLGLGFVLGQLVRNLVLAYSCSPSSCSPSSSSSSISCSSSRELLRCQGLANFPPSIAPAGPPRIHQLPLPAMGAAI